MLGAHDADVVFEKGASTGGFPKIRGTILGVQLIRTIVLGGLYGNYQLKSP